MKNSKSCIIFSAMACLLVACAAPTEGDTSEQFWALSQETRSSGEDRGASTCTLHESNGRAFAIEVSFYTLDANPPVNYPTIRLVQMLGNNGPMAVSGEPEAAQWQFDNEETVQTFITHDYVEQQNAFYLAPNNAQSVLAGLTHAKQVTITNDTLGSIEYDVVGFETAYKDMVDACGFETSGILTSN